MTPTRPVQTLDRFFAPSKVKKTSLVEKVAVVASMTAIVVLILVDVVKTAPPDATFTEITFDAAPDTGWALPAATTDGQRANDESARVSRADAIR